MNANVCITRYYWTSLEDEELDVSGKQKKNVLFICYLGFHVQLCNCVKLFLAYDLSQFPKNAYGVKLHMKTYGLRFGLCTPFHVHTIKCEGTRTSFEATAEDGEDGRVSLLRLRGKQFMTLRGQMDPNQVFLWLLYAAYALDVSPEEVWTHNNSDLIALSCTRKGPIKVEADKVSTTPQRSLRLSLPTTCGDFEHVLALDFDSMYPSILLRERMLESLDPKLHTLLGSLIEAKRRHVNTQVALSFQKVCKYYANVMYGLIGYKGFFKYSPDICFRVRKIGMTTLRDTAKLVETQFDATVVFGKTDSLFLIRKNKHPWDVEKGAQVLCRAVEKKWALPIKVDFYFKRLVMERSWFVGYDVLTSTNIHRGTPSRAKRCPLTLKSFLETFTDACMSTENADERENKLLDLSESFDKSYSTMPAVVTFMERLLCSVGHEDLCSLFQ